MADLRVNDQTVSYPGSPCNPDYQCSSSTDSQLNVVYGCFGSAYASANSAIDITDKIGSTGSFTLYAKAGPGTGAFTTCRSGGFGFRVVFKVEVFESSPYIYVSMERRFLDAKAICKNTHGGSLAPVRSAAEFNALVDFVDGLGLGNNKRMWTPLGGGRPYERKPRRHGREWNDASVASIPASAARSIRG